jgi:hypothetical protein
MQRGKDTQLLLAGLLRQPVYSRMAGYEDVNDAERVSQDPTLRLIGSERIWERGAALTSRLQSLQTDVATDAATVWRHGAADRRAALADRIRRRGGQGNRSKERGGTVRCTRSRFR